MSYDREPSFDGIVVERDVYVAMRDGVRDHNIPVVQFLSMFISTIYVVSNLAADIGTILVTPRLRTRLS